MRLRFRFLEYLTITSFVWGLYLCFLIPLQLFIVEMTWDQFIKWLWIGTIFEMFFAYFLTKVIVYVTPRISKWYENK